MVKYDTVRQWNIPIHPEHLVIKGIGGKLHSEGYVYIPLSINGKEIIHKFYVLEYLPCLQQGLIGQDFLVTFNCILNYENNTITFNNLANPIVLPIGSGRPGTYITVPSRCEKVFQIDSGMQEACVILPKELCEGVFIAGSICQPKQGKISIQILNTRDKEIGLNYFKPDVDKLSHYTICSFEKQTNLDGERVRKLLSLVKLDHLNKEESISIQNICAKFSDVFFLPGDKLGTCNLYEQNIQLKPNADSVYIKQYRLPFSQRNEIENQVQNMLANGIIEPARSEWSSPVLLVPKKSDDNTKRWRLVIDFRKLNDRIMDDKFPLPNISDILDSLSGAIYFSQLDLTQAYFQSKLNTSSRKYTAFTTPSGQYQMTRMPMGLKTSPSAFSRLMTVAMSGLNYDKCFVYLDNLICFGRNLEIHNKNLLDILYRLRKVNLKLNPDKCDFLRKEILYLGHVVSADGIKPDPGKIKALSEYPVPKNSDELKRFIAFANYYRKFIRNFAEICIPLNNLCCKNVVFDWDKNCQNSFLILKSALTEPPILQYPKFDDKNTFILQTDASGFAIGSVLCNADKRPVAYASRSLNKAERRYPTIEKELLAIVWSIKYFRPYLYGRKFIIETDHRPLVYLYNMTDPSSRLLKFRLLLEEYDYKVVYVKGCNNVAADALSRIEVNSDELKSMNEHIVSVLTRAQKKKLEGKICDNASVINIPTNDWTDHPRVVEILKLPKYYTELLFVSKEEWKKVKNVCLEKGDFAYSSSHRIVYVKLFTQSQRTRAVSVRELESFCMNLKIDTIYIVRDDDNFHIIKELAHRINKLPKWSGPRLCIIKGVKKITDDDTKRVILNDYHILPTSGHAGIRRMMNNIRKKYFWTGMEHDVTNFVKKCNCCQRYKYLNNVKEPMVITDCGTSAFDKVYLDLVGPLIRDNNYSYILTLQCDLTKYVEAYPIAAKDARTVATCLVNNFILRYGIPRKIVTDRGTEFINSTMEQVCQILNIKHLKSTAYHHETLGSLENSHKHLTFYLRMQINSETQEWSSWLPYWCFSYNTSVHSSTKFTPYELVFGKQCNVPSNITNNIDPIYNFDNYAIELKYRLQKSQTEAKGNLLNCKLLRKTKYDNNVNPITYKTGDFILVKNENCNKLDPLYVGPFPVVKDIAPNVIISVDGKEKCIHKNRTRLYNQ